MFETPINFTLSDLINKKSSKKTISFNYIFQEGEWIDILTLCIYDLRTTTQAMQKLYSLVLGEENLLFDKTDDICKNLKYLQSIADYIIHYLNVKDFKNEFLINDFCNEIWSIDTKVIYMYIDIVDKIIDFINKLSIYIDNKIQPLPYNKIYNNNSEEFIINLELEMEIERHLNTLSRLVNSLI